MDASQRMNIEVVILAGGEGRRIGGSKPLKMLAGLRMIDHVISRVRAWGLPAAISVRDSRQDDYSGGLPLLHDDEGAGPIAGVACALRHAAREGRDAVLTLPCDTPFLPDDLPARLAAALVPPARAATARSGGRLHPSCALWSVHAAEHLDSYLLSGRSLTGFAEQLQAAVVDWPSEPWDPFFNVNSEADLVAAERIFKSR